MIRRWLYGGLRFSNDVRAVRRGRVGRRVARRYAGRMIGRLFGKVFG